MNSIKDNFKNEFKKILSEGLKDFNPAIEDDESVITIITDIDNNEVIFGGLCLRDALEEEGEYNPEETNVYKIAKSKYLVDCFNELLGNDTIPEDDEEYLLEQYVGELYNIIKETIDENDDLKDKIDNTYLLSGWAKFGRMAEVQSNPFY